MKKKMSTLIIIGMSFLITIMVSITCNAEEWSRKGKVEIFGLVQQMTGDSTTGLGMTIKVDDTIGVGAGVGYNMNDYLNLNASICGADTDLTVNGATVLDTSLLGVDLNLDYNLLKSHFTPMITAGIGSINFSSDTGNIDANETDFSYNCGAGIRWDISDHFLIKVLYRAAWSKLEDTDDSILFNGVYLSMGYSF